MTGTHEGSEPPVGDEAAARRTRSRETTPSIIILDRQSVDRERLVHDMKREKSPFEIGRKKEVQIASQKAVIDKAAIMDITGGVAKNIDEFIQLYFNDYCIIDKASVLDISPASVKIVIVEEDEPEEDDSQAKKKLRRNLEKIVQWRLKPVLKKVCHTIWTVFWIQSIKLGPIFCFWAMLCYL